MTLFSVSDRRWAFLVSCLFALGWGGHVAAAASSERVVEMGSASPVMLSPFEVKANGMDFRGWLKVASPHFVIYTDAGKDDATQLITQMEMLRQGAEFYFKRRILNGPPLFVVMPSKKSDWRKIGSRGGVSWKVATSLVGYTQSILLVQYDWQSDDLSPVWGLVGLHEVNEMNLFGPLWFQKGASIFFDDVTFTPDSLTLGREDYYADHIRSYGWLEWRRFFEITRTSPEYTQTSRDGDRFIGQCAVFAHHLLTSGDAADLSRLVRWASYLEAGNEPTEEAFKSIFQSGWESWQERLSATLQGGEYTVGHVKFPPAALRFTISTAEPPAREMRELFVVGQILNQRTPESVASLKMLRERGLKTEWLRELMAEACRKHLEPADTLSELRTVIAHGSANPRVYGSAAELLLDEAAAKYTLDKRVTSGLADIRTWCGRALELEPTEIDANETLAWAEALAETIDAKNLQVIRSTCRNLDGNGPTDSVLAALAVARWRTGEIEKAGSLAKQLVDAEFSRKRVKTLAQALLERIDQDGKAPKMTALAATPVAN
jgi:hypothetical protein